MYFCFKLCRFCKWSEHLKKWRINRNLSKPIEFKGKVQTKFKSTDKACNKCEQGRTVNFWWNRGGDLPRWSIFRQIAVCSHFLHAVSALLDLFWTCPLNSIGLRRFRLISLVFCAFRFSKFSESWQHLSILQKMQQWRVNVYKMHKHKIKGNVLTIMNIQAFRNHVMVSETRPLRFKRWWARFCVSRFVRLSTFGMFRLFNRFSRTASDCIHYWLPPGCTLAPVLRLHADVRDICCLCLSHVSGDSESHTLSSPRSVLRQVRNCFCLKTFCRGITRRIQMSEYSMARGK